MSAIDTIKKGLFFLRLIDEDNKISLTNIAVWISLVKLCMAANIIAPTDLGALIAALGSYQAKRWIKGDSAS